MHSSALTNALADRTQGQESVEIFINEKPVCASQGATVLEAAREAGIYVPSLCFHVALPSKDVNPSDFVYQGATRIEHEQEQGMVEPCGLCIVHVEGREKPLRSCAAEVEQGMVIFTDTPEIQDARRDAFRRILKNHPNICLSCDRVPRCPPFGVCVRSANVTNRCVACPGYFQCEIITISDHIGMIGVTIPFNESPSEPIDDNPFFQFDPALCVDCLRCVRLCRDVRGVNALGFVVENGMVRVGTRAPSFLESGCRFCMGCVEICPTGALTDKKEKWKEFSSDSERREQCVPCTQACPLGIDVPQYVYYVSQQRFEDALGVIEESLPFSQLCGRLCTHECEQVCRRAELDEPVSVMHLKRFVAEEAKLHHDGPLPSPSGKRVAVVGSGPAGLTAAYYLAHKGGHAVTIFEAHAEPGGIPRTCIPRFRLPASVMDSTVERVRQRGVEILTHRHVESVDELQAMGFDAVLLATGAPDEVRLGVEGEERPSVMGALSFLGRVNSGEDVGVGPRVAVVGGGNAAVDAARAAVRVGAQAVTILYRRSREEMPADPAEIEHARAEGVNFMYLVSPLRITERQGALSIHLIKNKLGRPDRSGRKRPKPLKNTEFSMEVDTIITAIGQHPRPLHQAGLDTTKTHTLKVDETTLSTTKDGVFAAGDAVTGPWSVTHAIKMGTSAACAIDRYLGGNGFVLRNAARGDMPDSLDTEKALSVQRVVLPPLLSPEKCRGGFEEAVQGYTKDMAVREAQRCLRCSLRLRVSNFQEEQERRTPC